MTSPRPTASSAAALAALALLGVAAAPAPAATGPSGPLVLSVEQNDTTLDGWGGWLVWSRREGDGRFALVARTPDGRGLRLPIAPQPAPVDASVGPGPDGGPLVVYSTCARTGANPTGCDVRRLDLVTGADAPVPAAASPDVDERFPSVWGDRIAFARPRDGGRPERTGIAVAPLGAPDPVEPTVFGARTERRDGRRVAVPIHGPQAIDLRGTTIAASWRTAGVGPERWRLIVRRGRARPRSVLQATSGRGTISRLGRPALGPRDVVAPRQWAGTTNRSELVRATLSGSRAWTLRSGFSGAQTGRYGSALSAVARTTDAQLVVVRRLASDGRWSCRHPSLPDARGCELLALQAAAQPWRPVTR